MTYINPHSKVLRYPERLAGWAKGETPAPVTVEWDLSNRCVLGCQDCHFAHTHVRGPWAGRKRELPMAFDSCGDLAEFDLVVRAQGEMAEAGVQGVIYSGGGEPTTHPKWMDIVVRGSRVGLRQGMYTLGGLLSEPSAELLAEFCDWVVVSLDAADAATYAKEKGVSASRFIAAINGIRWLVKYDLSVVGVSYLLHAGNWQNTAGMLSLSRSLGATYTTFRPAIQTSPASPSACSVDRSWITSAMPALEAMALEPDVEVDPPRFAQYRDWQGHGYTKCYGPRLNTTITPDGRVWICPQRRGVGGSCLGDLRTESFTDIWKRHPGHYAVDEGCRVMCRLHAVNETLAGVYEPQTHEAFI